ncbi:MAG TPA: hypothetical protein DIU35_11300 [Candidatus Latescibacteria bacterium]|nr:hypothetical protein [Candidatus Latescibacterota bacterium]
MKSGLRGFTWSIIVLLVFGVAGGAFAERTVVVEQGFGTLNEAVDGDTTASGERVDLNTVYVLASGGTYLLNGSIENRFPLTIVAEDGATVRPKLIPGVPTGGSSSRAFRARADITLRGLYITNEDELGALKTRIIRISADNVRAVIDDCHLDKDGQSGFRLDNDGNRIFITNSIISNIGKVSSPNNGRGIDDRGNDIDTLVISNTTIYNLTSTVLRDGGGGIINYFDFNHNTVVNTGMQAIEIGEVVEAHVTNNIFINGVYFGTGPQGGSEITEGYHILVYELNADLVAEGVTQTVNIRHNNFYTDPAVIATWPDYVNESISEGDVRPLFNEVAQAAVDASGKGDTNISEAVAFVNGAPSPVAHLEAWYAGQPGGIPIATSVETALPFDNSSAPFDFAYSGGESATHSTGGQPLGSLIWHNMEIADSDRGLDDKMLPGDGDGDGDSDGGDITLTPAAGSGEWTLDLDETVGDQEVREKSVKAGDEVIIEMINNESISPALGGAFTFTYDATKVTPNASAISGIASPLGAPSIGDGTISFTLAGLSGVAVTDGHVGQIGFTVGEGFDADTEITLTKAEIGDDTTYANVASEPGASVVLRAAAANISEATPDLDGDGVVGFPDFIKFAQAFGSKTDDDKFNAGADLDSNGAVEFRDFVLFAQNYGKNIEDVVLPSSKIVGPGLSSASGLTLIPGFGQPGLVTLTVRVTDAVNVSGYSLTVQYDASTLAWVGAEGLAPSKFADQDEVALQVADGPGQVVLSDITGSAVQGDGDLVQLQFQVLDQVRAGRVEIVSALVSDPSGNVSELLGAHVAEIRMMPEIYVLGDNYPNPFNPETVVPFAIPEKGDVRVAVYNLLGQEIAVLASGRLEAGFHRVTWNGNDAAGNAMSTGIYFVRMVANGFTDVNKVMLLK